MPDFLKTFVDLDENFIRGAARMLWAGTTIAFPTTLGDVVNLSTYDAQTGWNDLGATKTGIQITVNNTEETFDVDQILTDLDSRPTAWEVQVGTQLAEMTLARMQFAWDGGAITTVGNEDQMGVGAPTTYIRRRLAVLFQKPNGRIRGYIFRNVQRTPQESAINFAKTGEQQSVPVRFRALADTSVAEARERIFMVFDQTS